jgi:hypothetical protein
MKRVREIYHRVHGYLRNWTGEPVQVGGLFGFILEPWPTTAGEIPQPLWEAAPELGPGVFFTDECTGLYSTALEGIRPGRWGGIWVKGQPIIYAPVVYVISEDVEIPPDRHDLIRRWQI